MTAAALGALALGTSAAQAAPPAFDKGVRIDQLQPASPESAFFRAEGPHNPEAEGVEFAAGATFEYGKGLLREVGVDKSGTSRELATLVDNAVLARIQASITPLHWLSFDVAIPFDLFESGDKPKPWGGVTPRPATGPGVGDLRIGVHFRPIDTRSFGLILGGRFWAPFGSEGSYLSDRTFRAEVDLGVAGETSRLYWGATFNIAPGFFASRSGDRMAVAGALQIKAGEIVSVGLEPTFEMLTHTNPNGDAKLGFIFEPLGALRLRFGGVRVGVAAGPGFGGAPGSADIRTMLSVAYVGLGKPPKPPPVAPSDRDLDKIPDDQDACPDEAGPANDDPKLNGCPAHDRDGDGIPDDKDFCPDRPGIPHPDPKGNGCPDSDNDGIPDPIDECKNEPGAAPAGCPKYARLQTGGFKIDPPLEFGAKDEKLSKPNRAALEEVAATMRANPNLEKLTIAIGTKGVKPAVADKRAQDVLEVMRTGNLDSSRYEVLLRDDLRGGILTVRLGK